LTALLFGASACATHQDVNSVRQAEWVYRKGQYGQIMPSDILNLGRIAGEAGRR
jgi:hypothetical protein